MSKAIYDIRHAEICGALSAARKSKNLTFAQVAEELSRNGRTILSAEAIGQVERGQRKLDIVEFVDLASAIGVPWLRLLPDALTEGM